MSLIWVIAFLGLLLVEFLTVGLVSIWFAVGALAALITSFITESVLIQTIVFVVASIVTYPRYASDTHRTSNRSLTARVKP